MRTRTERCRVRIFLVLFLLVGILQHLFTNQSGTVILLSLENRSGDNSLDILSDTIRTALDLNLNLLGGFDTQLLKDVDLQGSVGLKDDATIVSGWYDRDAVTGFFSVYTQVYDTLGEQVLVEAIEEANTLFEVFDAADRLTGVVLEAIAGRPIHYGGLSLVHIGYPLPTELLLNERVAGRDTSRLSGIVVGEYRLVVQQDRLHGPEVIHEEDVQVRRETETVIRYRTPDISPGEREHFTQLDAELRAAWKQESHEGWQDLLTATLTNLEAAPASPGYALLLSKYRAWQSMLSQAPAAVPPGAEAALSLSERATSFSLTQISAVGPNPLARRETLSSTVARYRNIPYREISIDGNFLDWEGVNPVFERPESGHPRDFFTEYSAMSIKRIYLARDDRNLYLRYVFADGDIDPGAFPSYKLHFQLPDSEWDHVGIQLERGRSRSGGASPWKTQVFLWSQSQRRFREIATGASRRSGNSFEASFPLRAVGRWLTPGQRYSVRASTGTMNDGYSQIDTASFTLTY